MLHNSSDKMNCYLDGVLLCSFPEAKLKRFLSECLIRYPRARLFKAVATVLMVDSSLSGY
jgi:hypothetical protein